NHPEQHERFPQLQGCDCLGNITAESGAPSWCTGLPGTTACPCPPTAPTSSGTPEPSCSANSPTAPASPKPWPRTCPPAPPPPGGTEPRSEERRVGKEWRARGPRREGREKRRGQAGELGTAEAAKGPTDMQ